MIDIKTCYLFLKNTLKRAIDNLKMGGGELFEKPGPGSGSGFRFFAGSGFNGIRIRNTVINRIRRIKVAMISVPVLTVFQDNILGLYNSVFDPHLL